MGAMWQSMWALSGRVISDGVGYLGASMLMRSGTLLYGEGRAVLHESDGAFQLHIPGDTVELPRVASTCKLGWVTFFGSDS